MAAIMSSFLKTKKWKESSRESFYVLKWEDVEIGEPKEVEVRVTNKAIGVNFVDIYFWKGVYKAPFMPFTPENMNLYTFWDEIRWRTKSGGSSQLITPSYLKYKEPLRDLL